MTVLIINAAYSNFSYSYAQANSSCDSAPVPCGDNFQASSGCWEAACASSSQSYAAAVALSLNSACDLGSEDDAEVSQGSGGGAEGCASSGDAGGSDGCAGSDGGASGASGDGGASGSCGGSDGGSSGGSGAGGSCGGGDGGSSGGSGGDGGGCGGGDGGGGGGGE